MGAPDSEEHDIAGAEEHDVTDVAKKPDITDVEKDRKVKALQEIANYLWKEFDGRRDRSGKQIFLCGPRSPR